MFRKTTSLKSVHRWLFVVLVFFCHSSWANTITPTAQEDFVINLAKGTYKLSKIFRSIEKETGLMFNYGTSYVNAKEEISITGYSNAKLQDVLKELLTPRKLKWSIIGKDISLSPVTAQNDKRVSQTPPDSTITVTGKVLNEKGMPIVGATVQVKGTSLGTTTDSDGNFRILGVQPNASLIITNVAYLTKEISLHGKGNIGATQLADYVGILDEAQIIAYGKTSRRFNTGDVTTVKAEEIARQPVNNPLLALAGRVPGLQVTQVNGISGGGVKVLIQGQNSLRSGNDPFYVIDGVPFTSQLLANQGNVLGNSSNGGPDGATGNPLSFINPQDIESIEVLKDADATAIYGSRASNGAILITTKKGISGQTKVDLNLQSGIGQVSKKLDLLRTPQYLEVRKEAMKNDGVVPSGNPAAQFPQVYAPDIKFWDSTRYTDWQNELIGNTAHYNDAQMTVSGGSGLTNYLIGGNYHKETTVFPKSLSDRKGSLHFSVNSASQNNKFRISLSGSYLFDNNQLISTDLTEIAMSLSPNAPPLYNTDGALNWEYNSVGQSTFPSNSHPGSKLLQKYQNKTGNLISNINIGYELANGLELSSNLGFTNLQSTDILYGFFPSAYPIESSQLPRKTYFGDNNISSWIIEPQINYKKNVGVGQLSVLIGTTVQQRHNSRELLEASGFNSDLVMENINAATSVVVPVNTSIASVYKYNALFGRINYNVKSKYILNLSARRDGSSRFGSENHFHNFGAIGAAWIFSKEKWIENNYTFLSFGKLRTSFGTTGNDQIGDYYFMSLYDNINGEIPYRSTGGLTPRNISNPYLQWEETKKLQVGLDVGLLHDNILLNATYFRNRSSNQLLLYTLPITTGVSSIPTNLPATIQNNGWEFSITSNNIKIKQFKWTTYINLTVPNNKMVKYQNLNVSSYSNTFRVGQPFTTKRLYKFNGINTMTGIYEFVDKDGKTVEDPTSNILNQTVIVNTAQSFYGGLSNAFTYRGLQLDFLLQFVKQKGIDNFFGNVPGAPVNQPTTILSRWQKSGDMKEIQKYNSDYSIVSSQTAASQSDAAWADASYVRLKNLSISWQLPESILQKITLNSFKLFVQGQNLLTFTKYRGLDPETLSSVSLPPLRVITFGISASL